MAKLISMAAVPRIQHTPFSTLRRRTTAWFSWVNTTSSTMRTSFYRPCAQQWHGKGRWRNNVRQDGAFKSPNLLGDWRSLTISHQASKHSCSIPLNGNLRWTEKTEEKLILRGISLQKSAANQLQQWSMNRCMVQRMGSHKEGSAKW